MTLPLRRWLVGAALATAVIPGSARDAHAQDPAGGLPVRYVDRPLTLPKFTLQPGLGASVQRSRVFRADADLYATLNAEFGITDDIEVGLTPFVSRVTGGVAFESGGVARGGLARFTYRFLRETVEMGAYVQVTLPYHGEFVAWPGLPIRVHIGDSVRLDTGVFFRAQLTGAGYLGAGKFGLTHFDPYRLTGIFPDPGGPARFAFQLADQGFLLVETGLGIYDFDHPGDTFFIPFGIGGGGTIERKGQAFVDLQGTFNFPVLFVPGNDRDAVGNEFWNIMFSAKFYIPLG